MYDAISLQAIDKTLGEIRALNVEGEFIVQKIEWLEALLGIPAISERLSEQARTDLALAQQSLRDYQDIQRELDQLEAATDPAATIERCIDLLSQTGDQNTIARIQRIYNSLIDQVENPQKRSKLMADMDRAFSSSSESMDEEG